MKDIDWKCRYNSGEDNLIRDFFIPALSVSKYYYRIAGYFSSTSIAAAFRGISSFIETGEKMKLIVGNELSEMDIESIMRGNKKLDEVLLKKWEEIEKELENDIVKNRFELLAWLIANDKLEIKIGINIDKNGRYIPYNKSLFHEKVLIFEDEGHNRIQLDGSINETWSAWKNNRESFCVHKSWVEGQDEFITSAKETFDMLWEDIDLHSRVINLPEAVKEKLIKQRPKNRPSLDESDFESEYVLEKKEENKKLRKYQEEAIEAWINNEYIGILEMAT
ncbi:MAG TPA: phospholipase D-like domain-containing protein, partial [Candidatus Methanofastidiosa archaeon]|nr:phospholipase D-like domain-containing protein [Candidatus Methanofastidiosa archaeon]